MKKPRGMKNLDNTCYAISTIQVLFHIQNFNYLITNTAKLNSQSISRLMKKTFCGLKKDPRTSFDPKELRVICEKLGFNLKEQNDSNEFYMRLIHRLSEEISEFKDLTITLKRTTECSKCFTKTEDCVKTFYLTISAELYPDIQSGLISNFEQLFGNSRNCCGTEFEKSSYEIIKHPRDIFVLIDRVYYDEKGIPLKSSKTIITNKFVTLYSDKESFRYGLKGIVLHNGESAIRGHYYAYVNKQQNWFVCDDTFGNNVSANKVKEMSIAHSPSLIIYSIEK